MLYPSYVKAVNNKTPNRWVASQEKTRMTVIPIIIEQHAEDAAFNWLLRDAAVSEPHYSLDDLAKLDNRVEAHIDGLRIAGDEGWEICKEALSWEEAGEVFVAAVLAFESCDTMSAFRLSLR